MEIAGIALAIFPLVVKGLYSLLDASRTVKNLRDYHWVLGRLVRQFNMEKSKFGNTCGEILGELVTRELLIGKGWDDPDFQEILEARFRPHTAKLFIDLICFLRSNLQELIDKLELDKIQKPTLLDKYIKRRLWKKIKLVLQEGEHQALLDHIYKINADLHRLLIIHSDHVVEPLQPTVMKTTKTYARIRKHAIKLHDVFQEKFHTEHGCPDIPHNVDLPLQRVSADEKGHDSEAVKLRVLFSLDIWNEIEFELVDCPEYAHATTRDVVVGSNDGKSGTGAVRWAGLGGGVVEGGNTEPIKAKRKVMFDIPERNQSPSLGAVREIENLCFEIRRAKSICSKCCLGILVAAGVQWRLWPAADPLSSRYILETVSLDSLLQRGTLDRRDRLQLAVQLAKVMMHLHATQWLGERWGKRDIFFPQVTTKAEDDSGKLVTVRKPMTNNPLVRQTFGSLEHPSTGTPGQSEATSTTPCLLRYDRSLFSLGIILIELLIGKRVEDLPEYPEDSYQLDDNAEYQTADRLITSGRIDMEADTIYGGALRRCIRGLDCNATSLEDDGFKHEVQVKVIAELEKFWNTYARKLEAKP